MKRVTENAKNAVLKQGQLEGILIKCIESGKAEDAKRVVKRLKRKLRQKEIDLLVEKLMAEDMWEALEISDLGASQKAMDALAKYVLVEMGDFDEFKELLETGKVSRKSARMLLRESIQQGWLKSVKLISGFLKRRITRTEAITFIRKITNRSNIREQEAHEVISMRKGDKIVVKVFLRLLIDQGLTGEARRAAKILGRELSRRELGQLVVANVQEGRTSRALVAASMGSSAQYIEMIIRECIKRCDVEDATKAAVLNNRSLTSAELQAILNSAIEEGLVYHTKQVLLASELVPTEPQWKTLMDKCLRKGNIEDVFEVEKLRKKELSGLELSLLAESIAQVALAEY